MSAFDVKLLSTALRERWQNYQTRLKACMEEMGSESIHEFRVATRRLFSIVELIRAICPGRDLQNMQRELRNQLNDLDKISDVQMMMAKIEEVVQQQPEALPFLRHLQRREKRLLTKAAKYLKSLDEQRLNKQARLIQKLQESEIPVRKNLHTALIKALDAAFSAALERYRAIVPERTTTIHRLRIAFRKFRYMVEIVHPALRGYRIETLGIMREYQRKMGNIQDVETLLNYLEKYAKSHKRFEGASLLAYYREACAQAVLDFHAHKENIYRFWRSTRRTPFPWTSKRRTAANTSPHSFIQEEQTTATQNASQEQEQ